MNQLKNYLKCAHLIRSATYRNLATEINGEKTSLYDFHIANNGRMVNFGGYLLPVQYNDVSITNSHLHTRTAASIFDVSHMLQTYVRGSDAIGCFEKLCTADIQGLAENSGTLTVFTTTNGGIIDDLIVMKVNSKLLYVVSNASRKTVDSTLIREAVDCSRNSGKNVDVTFLAPDEQALIAVQGPKAVAALQDICEHNLSGLNFMHTTLTIVAGISNCRVTRCGYTGMFKNFLNEKKNIDIRFCSIERRGWCRNINSGQ